MQKMNFEVSIIFAYVDDGRHRSLKCCSRIPECSMSVILSVFIVVAFVLVNVIIIMLIYYKNDIITLHL